MKKILNLVKSHRTFIKFLIVGGLNTAFGYLIFALFIWLGVHYSLASFLSTILGIIFNFFTTGRLVFKNKDNSLIFRFFAVYGISYLINITFIWLITLSGYQNMYIIGLALIIPCAVISYVLMKVFVFGEKKQRV